MSELAEVLLRPLQIVATRTDASAEALLRRHFHAGRSPDKLAGRFAGVADTVPPNPHDDGRHRH